MTVKRRNIFTYSAGLVTKTIDKYPESNDSAALSSSSSQSGRAQSFTNVNKSTLTSCKLMLRRTGTITGSTYAYIYTHTGTYGVNGYPGTLLATSDPILVSTIPTSKGLVEFTFSGANQITLTTNTYYCVVFFHPNATGASTDFYVDTTSPSHSGNNASSSNGGASWFASSVRDSIFYVYGLGPISIVN